MILKVVSLFLIGMLVLAMFGRIRVPKIKNPLKKDRVGDAKKCKKCGTYIVGDGPCACLKRG